MRVDPGVKPLRISGLTQNWAETGQEITPRDSLGGDVQIVGFDEADQTLQAVTKGTISGTVVQDPYRQIRRNNVDQFWTDLKSKLEGSE